MVPVGGGEEPRRLLGTGANERTPALSPDGRWLAYASDETGIPQVFVVPFPGVESGKWQISSAGAGFPRWSRDGLALFMISLDAGGLDASQAASGRRQGIGVAHMREGPARALSRPLVTLFPDEYWELDLNMYDVAPDGRFLMDRAGLGDHPGDLILVQNFFEELKRLVRN
jgi:serine/threonine-protein kinase